MTNVRLFIKISVGVIILFVALFSIFGYAVNQGFNPSDEGVILSQSWRLLQGEIPHKEFISIRPVGSGIIHQIDLLLPFPILTTARIIAAFEYLLLSIIWSLILIRAFANYIHKKNQPIIYFSVIASTFVLNLNNGPIFTWTTTDALLLTSIGFYFLMLFFKSNYTNQDYKSHALPSIIFVSASVLCRQSFALPLFLLVLTILFYNFHFKKLPFRIIIVFLGAAPLLLYFFYLLYHGALQAFVQQMTGRTELVDTGITTYSKSLAKYWWLIFIYIGILPITVIKLRLLQNSVSEKILVLYNALLTLVTLWFTFHLFLGNYSSDYSFFFFWLLAFLLLQSIVLKQYSYEINIVLLITLIIAWTSSISIGDNSPRPFFGGIVVASLFILFHRISQIHFLKKRMYASSMIVLSLCALLIVLSQLSMPRLNYRDWTSSRLQHTLEDIMPEMGGTKVNHYTRKYFEEFDRIYNLLEKPKDKFAMIPNNAFIYVIMHSHNPLTLDWMQHHEYIGAELQFTNQVSTALNNQKVYVIMDKIDSKQLFKGEIAFEPELEFNHSYIPWLKEQLVKMPIESKYFEVYESSYQNFGH